MSITHRTENPICQRCLYLGSVDKVSCEKLSVHHIKMVEYNPDLAYDDDNLLTLCVPCHKHFDMLELSGRNSEAELEGEEIREATCYRGYINERHN